MPWICNLCGEVAEGDMCLGCGKSRGHGPIMRDDRIAGYRSGPLVEGTNSTDPTKWGPITWVAVAFFVVFVALCATAGLSH